MVGVIVWGEGGVVVFACLKATLYQLLLTRSASALNLGPLPLVSNPNFSAASTASHSSFVRVGVVSSFSPPSNASSTICTRATHARFAAEDALPSSI